jgi:putative methyltransferase (TIGR04325 family)
VRDENPWVTDAWVKLNKSKSADLPIGRYSELQSGLIPEQSHILIPSFILNNFGSGAVLDFGGGAGNTYFGVSGFLRNLQDVRWYVFDENRPLYDVGVHYAKHRTAKNISDNLFFTDILPDVKIDLINISSTLQYIDDWCGLIAGLVGKYCPTYFVLTRTLAGNIAPFVTRQDVHGKSTPCRFLNVQEISCVLGALGYEEILNYPGGSIDSSQFDGIPVSRHISRCVDLVFKYKSE